MPFCIKIEARFWYVEGEDATYAGNTTPEMAGKKAMDIVWNKMYIFASIHWFKQYPKFYMHYTQTRVWQNCKLNASALKQAGREHTQPLTSSNDWVRETIWRKAVQMSLTSPIRFFFLMSLPLSDFAEHSKGVRATKEQLSSQEREREADGWMNGWIGAVCFGGWYLSLLERGCTRR